MAAETIVIDERFRGPPASGNGGYVAGRLAAFVDADAVEVRLSAPPPLDTPLTVERDGDGSARLLDGDAVVALARPGALDLSPPVTVDLEAAADAQQRTHLRAEDHPFPTCFGCGPLRSAGDALRHLCGPVGDGPVMACVATTDPELPLDGNGALAPEIVWAALDCPSAAATVPPGARAHVLATFTARLDRPVVAGRPHVCVAWPLGAEGRKRRAGSAVLDADGHVCAVAEALWIELRG
jgi:hypothetical protein